MKNKKNYIHILVVVLVLLTDELLYPFDSKTEGGLKELFRPFLFIFPKVVPLLSAIYLFLSLKKLNKFLLFFTGLVSLYSIILLFESLYLYDSVVEYPHVILKIFNLYITLGITAYFVANKNSDIKLIMDVILFAVMIKIIINPRIISLQAFLTHDRGIPAPSAYLLSLPCIYFFNKYLVEIKLIPLLKFVFLFLLVLVFNHRTVWVTISFSLLLNLILLKKNSIKVKTKTLLSSFALFLSAGLIVGSLIVSYSPNVLEKVNENVNNIINLQEDDTAGWRIIQMESYWPFVKEKIFAGLRWKGFELPIQFYHPEAGTPYFDDGSGHHFHSFYFDRLFYFGIIGVIIFLMIMFYPMINLVLHNIHLDTIGLSFFIFSVSGLVYGLAYDLPVYYWLILGLSISNLDLARSSKNIEPL